MAASGNIHPGQVSLFEPIHGSAPKYKGKGVANPVATVMAVALMLDHLGHAEAARDIESTVADLLQRGVIESLSGEDGPLRRPNDNEAAIEHAREVARERLEGARCY